MRVLRVLSIAILVAIVAVIVYAGVKRQGPNQFETAFVSGGKVALDLSAGGYDIMGTTDSKIRVEISPNETRDVHCRINVIGTKSKVEIDGPSNNFHATIYVPQRSDLDVDQTIGDLVVSNVEGNKSVSLGIGRVQLEVPNGTASPNFDGSVLLGSLRATTWHVEKGGFFRSFETRSAGPYSIKAHVDIGDLEVVNVGQGPKVGDSHPQKSEDADDDVSNQDSDHDAE